MSVKKKKLKTTLLEFNMAAEFFFFCTENCFSKKKISKEILFVCMCVCFLQKQEKTKNPK